MADHQDRLWEEGRGKEGQALKGWKPWVKNVKDLNCKDLSQSSRGKASLAKENTATNSETKELIACG